MAVRQTHNRQLCDLAKSSFAKVLPSTWRFVFTSGSLEALQRLTADRVYAVRCKALSFGTGRLVPSSRVPPAMARTSEPRGTKTSQSKLVVTAEMHTASVKLHKERQADANQHKELHARQDRFIKAGGHTALIIKSLLNLQAVGNTETTLGVYDDDRFCLVTDARYAGFASRDAYVTPCGKALAKNGAVFDTLGSLSNAICSSEYPVKRLEFELSNKIPSFDDDRSWRKLDPLPDIRMQIARFTKPSTLDISVLNSSLTIVNTTLWDETFRSGILYCPFIDRLYGNASDGAFVTSFRTVKLRSGSGYYEAIEKLLNPGLVEFLEIDGFSIGQTGNSRRAMSANTAVTLLQHIKSMPNLKELVLESIRDTYIGIIQSDRVHWTGQAEIHAGLDALIAKLDTWDWVPQH